MVLNSIALTAAYSGLFALKIDLIYFFTSFAIGTNPVGKRYNVLSRAILELVMFVKAADSSLFFSTIRSFFAFSVVIFKAVSFGA